MKHVERAEWMTRGNCRTMDPDEMQPDVATKPQVAEAIAVCNGCPVRAECLASAQSQGGAEGRYGAYGVWAGRWWGEPPRRPTPEEVVGVDVLRQLLDEGRSLSWIADEFGLTVGQVTGAKQRLSA